LFLCDIHKENTHLLDTAMNREELVEMVHFPYAVSLRAPLGLLKK